MNELKKELSNIPEEDCRMLAIISFVFSLLSLFWCYSFIFTLLFSVASIVTGVISLHKNKDYKLAKAGIIISIITIILSIIFLIVYATGIMLIMINAISSM